MNDGIEMWLHELANSGWNVENCIGNVMLLIIMAFLMCNVARNKKLNIMQLSGNILLLTICFLIVAIRR